VKTTISTKGQIVLPAELRDANGIAAGEQFDIARISAGEYRLTRVAPTPNVGVIDWLRSCPATGCFSPCDRSRPTPSDDRWLCAASLMSTQPSPTGNARDRLDHARCARPC
jgi:AbrB family looped-hinge helix DNA binding protein